MNEITQNAEMQLLSEMKKYFYLGKTKQIEFRIKQLKQLEKTILDNEAEVIEALKLDLGRHPLESYAAEIGSVLSSISYTIKKIKKWSKSKKVRTPLHQLGSKSYIKPEPYGVVLIIGPFNYPFNLLIEPLIGAMAAGNCIVLKPSEQTPTVTRVIASILRRNFNQNYIRVVEGEKEVTSRLIHSPFDYIFFTGSVPIGKIVMEAASKNLVPVTLELGGKSPCIVDETANIKVAAERVTWGKLFNTGQTCIAPDYLIVHESIKDVFISEIIETIRRFYGDNISQSQDYGRIVNQKHTKRLIRIVKEDYQKVIFGGAYNLETNFIEPTLVDRVNWDDACMQEELFGPILPIMTYKNFEKVITMINEKPKPLALYLFSNDKTKQSYILNNTSSGGCCINDTLSHFTTHYLPFGGVGNSGIGSYHGVESFKTFSHMKSVLCKTTKLRISMVFPPYKEMSYKLIKKILR